MTVASDALRGLGMHTARVQLIDYQVHKPYLYAWHGSINEFD